MACFRKLGGDVDLGATTIARLSDPFADPTELGVELRLGVLCVLFRDAIPSSPEVQIFALQKSGNKIVLRAEVAIETRFGDAGFLNHQVDAYGTHPLLVEKVRSGLQNLIP
jgi:hypothetical protein